MGMQTGKRKGPISEINITPFVDVVLVLLIIFMITAPLMFNGIALKLPKTKRVNQLNLSAEQVILSVNLSEEYFLKKEKVLRDELVPIIKKQFKEYKTDVVYLRAHYQIQYGKIAKLMSFLKRGGIQNISLVTEIENKS